MDEREDFEPDSDIPSFFGDNWKSVEDDDELELGNPTLVNEVDPDEFPAESADDITGLLTLGYLTDTFTAFGHSFTVRTLRRGEKMDALSLAREYEGTLGQADAVESALVAAAIEMVDGHPLTAPLSKSEKPIVRIKANFDKISNWYDPVVEAVYDRYSLLVGRQVAAFEALQRKSTAGRLSP